MQSVLFSVHYATLVNGTMKSISRQCIFRSEPIASYPGSFSWPHIQKEEVSLAGYEANLVAAWHLLLLSSSTHTHIHAHLHIWCTLARSCTLRSDQIIYGIALSPGNCLSAPFVMMQFCTSHKRSLVNSRTVLHV